MPISRGQMPRQLYGLGSFVKSIGKGIKKAVKGVKNFAKSDLGKVGLLALGSGIPFGGGSFFGGGSLFGKVAGSPLVSGILKSKAAGKIGNVLQDVAIGTGVAGLTDYLTKPDVDPSQMRTEGRTAEEIAEVESELRKNYKNLGYTESEIDLLVEQNMREYRAMGGRIGYARGDMAEQNAMQASGIMGLPLNENPAGVTELDLRETGGFIPPVGVKEKADDIPAMLSNNEFVFTADAVRGMGDGNVNLGAQRMYDMMKKLEKGGRV